MSGAANIFRVPVSITARKRNELTMLMVNINIKAKVEHRWFDISFDGKSWVAWYYQDVEEDLLKGVK